MDKLKEDEDLGDGDRTTEEEGNADDRVGREGGPEVAVDAGGGELESTNRQVNIDRAGYCSRRLFVYFNTRDRWARYGWRELRVYTAREERHTHAREGGFPLCTARRERHARKGEGRCIGENVPARVCVRHVPALYDAVTILGRMTGGGCNLHRGGKKNDTVPRTSHGCPISANRKSRLVCCAFAAVQVFSWTPPMAQIRIPGHWERAGIPDTDGFDSIRAKSFRVLVDVCL